MPLQEAIQDRAEFHAKFGSAITNSLVTGLDFRYQKLVSYQDFATEPFSHYDLYQSLSNVFYPGYYAEGKTWGGGFQIPGAPGFSAYTGSSGNQYSHIYDSAAFFQDTVGWTSKVSTVLGIREDYIAADTANPSLVQVGNDSEATDFTFYPITPTYVPKGALFKVSDTKVDPSYFLSLVIKMTDTQSFYLTYDHVDSILGSANFGGVNVNEGDSIANGGPGLKRALDNSLSTKSTLYEAGYKQSLLNNTLFVSADVFQQIKLGSEITGATFPIKDNGIEADAVYQPSKALTFNWNMTYQNATAFGTGFYQQTGNYLDNFAPGISVDGTHGTGAGGPNFESYDPPGNRMRAPGIPQFMSNAFIEYKWPTGFGVVGVGPQFIGKQYANDQDTLHVPGETEWDGYVFYNHKTWDVRVNIKNITDSRLIDPIDVSFAGNDTIFVRQPITASFTFPPALLTPPASFDPLFLPKGSRSRLPFFSHEEPAGQECRSAGDHGRPTPGNPARRTLRRRQPHRRRRSLRGAAGNGRRRAGSGRPHRHSRPGQYSSSHVFQEPDPGDSGGSRTRGSLAGWKSFIRSGLG